MGNRKCLIVSVFLVSILSFSGMLFAQRVIDLNQVWGDIRVLGRGADDRSGFEVASGDINGDGYMDIIIGAPQANPSGRHYAGEVYVIFGSSNPPSTIDLSTQSADITISGDDPGDYCGFSVSSGDINGDAFDDLIIGAFVADGPGGDRVGNTYVIFGSSDPPTTLDLSTQSADITVYGDEPWDQSGYAVASGDVNGDGFDDLIIGTNGGNAPGGSNAGATYVILGSSSPLSIIDLHSQLADITIYGDDVDDFSGFDVTSGDINGDSYCDIIIGAHMANPGGRFMTGETYVIFGGSFPLPPYTIDLNTQSADITIYGDKPEDNSGYTVSSGDVNGDGYYDVIIGAWAANPGGRSDAGKTYVIFGSSSPSSIIDLNSQSADITVYGDDEGDNSSHRLSSGDINNDGYDDIIIGAPHADPLGGTLAGETYVVYGFSPLMPVIIDLSISSANITVYGDDEYDESGRAVASGDINGDGCDDLIVGSPPHYKSDPGETYIIFGIAEVRKVEIDIKPGSFPNSINLGAGGTVPVAIFSTPTFDATTVDPTTVTLASAPVKLKGKGTPMASFEDVDGDGLLDLVVHVETQALELSQTYTEAVLEGETFDGKRIRGVDSVRVVP